MNKNKDHLSYQELLTIIDQTYESEKPEQTHKHLVGCQDCLQKWQEIRQMRVVLSTGKQPESPAGAGCLDEEKIAAYLDQGLADVEVQKLHQHIQTCDLCFYNLAHSFKCHQRLISEESNKTPIPSWLEAKAMSLNDAASKTPRTGWLAQANLALQRGLTWLRDSLFSPLPGYSLASIFLVLLLWQGSRVKPARLVSFPEATGLQIFAEIPVSYRNGPGDWAMTLDDRHVLQREPNFKGMKVVEEKDWGLMFTWPQMEGSREYNFTLFSRAVDKGRILVSVTTQEEIYAYSYDKYGQLDPNHIYEWVVSGKYGDGLHFKAKGSFTIVK